MSAEVQILFRQVPPALAASHPEQDGDDGKEALVEHPVGAPQVIEYLRVTV
jgi:hypothetical protein